MADIGHIALIIAFVAAVYSAVASAVGARSGSGALVMSARNGILVIAALYTLALAAVMYAFVTKDFSLKIVAEHANKDLPTIYAFSALYADKAGSVLFWGWLISLLAAVLALQKHDSYKQIMPCALSILAVILAFFLALVTLVVNVFDKNPVPTTDGFGLNPLLQNFGMLIHPPLLYIGFAGFAVVFAFVMAALITRSPGIEWTGGIRRWALFAWCALGLGNLVGMWWSYNELGWGGYWAWDPVENAGLMPWLVGTAFLHSTVMLRKRNYLHTWSFVLVIITFVFVLLSPFITHGGIESPLHGFYGSPYPPYILAAILVTLIGSLGLLYIRRKGFEEKEKPLSFISREGAFLLTNIIFVVLVFLIINGVVLPRIVEGLGGSKMALDRNYFDWSCGPIMLALVFFMGICSTLGWRKSSWHSVRRNLLYTLVPALIIATAILISGIGNWYAVAALICSFPLLTIFLEWFRGTKSRHRANGENCVRAFFYLIWNNKPRYGGFIVHIGIILIALGTIGSSFYGVENTATLDIGESMTVGDYELAYDDLTLKEDSSKLSAIASISVSRGDKLIGTMHPEYNYWFAQMQPFAEVAVRTTPAEDLFISMAWTSYDPRDESATFRALVNPLLVWMWIGGGFVLLGGVIAFWPDRRRQPGSEVNGR